MVLDNGGNMCHLRQNLSVMGVTDCLLSELANIGLA